MADTLDLLSLAEGKAAIGTAVAAVDLNTSVASYITAVSRTIDDNCGPMVQRTLTSEAYDGGAGTIRLASTPVVSVTTVTEYQATTAVACTQETAGTAPANGYVLDPRSGYLYRRTSGSDSRWAPGRRNIIATYVAGRYATTATVDPQVKQAASMLLRHLWAIQYGSGNATFGEMDMPTPIGFAIPNRVREMLATYWQVPAVY
jgi:hypothetical protein